jgi:hypothetical protein
MAANRAAGHPREYGFRGCRTRGSGTALALLHGLHGSLGEPLLDALTPGSMTRLPRMRRSRCFQWRVYDRRRGRLIETQLRCGEPPSCPECGGLLEAQPSSRMGRCVVLDAVGHDLDCRDCRRFWCVVRHTPRSVRLLRMRRLVAAVRAAGERAVAGGRGAGVGEAVA